MSSRSKSRWQDKILDVSEDSDGDRCVGDDG
jgi:hypothetical protein